MKLRPCIALFLSVLFCFTAVASGQTKRSLVASGNPDLRASIHSLDVAPVWSGHPVGFALLTHAIGSLPRFTMPAAA